MRLRDEVAIVTGAAQGLGKEIALGFGREGAAVTCLDAQAGGAQRTADAIVKAGGKALGIVGDVSLSGDVQSMVDQTVEAFSQISILVNNAGIFPRKAGRLPEDVPEAEWDQVIGVNLKGAFLCSKEVAKVMKNRGRGSIVNISSGIAFTGHRDGVHYASSKAGLLGLTKSLALAWAPFGIRVNCVAPGLADTAQPRSVYSEEQLIEAGRRIPLGRIARPRDIADAVLFLASQESSYITGQTLHVNGGSFLG